MYHPVKDKILKMEPVGSEAPCIAYMIDILIRYGRHSGKNKSVSLSTQTPKHFELRVSTLYA